MKTILVAIDLQHDARQMLARAAQLARQHQARVIAQHVVDDMDEAEASLQEDVENHGRGTLETLVGAAQFDTAPTLKIEFGVPHRCIVQAAHELAADILVLGPSRPSTMMERMFGSTADRIVRTLSIPVLVVRNETAQPYRRVAVAMDFSPLSDAALDAARKVAPDARITLVHAYEIPLPFEQAMRRTGTRSDDMERFRQARMEESRRRLMDLAQKHDRDESISVLAGAPKTALVELSRSGRVDLIALGSQGRNAVAQALLGSVARRLLCEAGCDLLVVGHKPA